MWCLLRFCHKFEWSKGLCVLIWLFILNKRDNSKSSHFVIFIRILWLTTNELLSSPLKESYWTDLHNQFLCCRFLVSLLCFDLCFCIFCSMLYLYFMHLYVYAVGWFLWFMWFCTASSLWFCTAAWFNVFGLLHNTEYFKKQSQMDIYIYIFEIYFKFWIDNSKNC